jgi:hypothetical protein
MWPEPTVIISPANMVPTTNIFLFYPITKPGGIQFNVYSYYSTPVLQYVKIEAAYMSNYMAKFDSRICPSDDKILDLGNPTNRWKTGYFESVDVGTSIWFSATERLAQRATNLYWCVAGNTGLVGITWGTPLP